MTFEKGLNLALSHAWNHFSYYASQRVQMFRYFVSLYSLFFAGAVTLIINGASIWPVAGVCVLAAVIAFIFRRLDNRNINMVTLSEEALRVLECELADSISPILLDKSATIRITDNIEQYDDKKYRYGKNFDLLFCIAIILPVALFGFAVYSQQTDLETSNTPSAIYFNSEER